MHTQWTLFTQPYTSPCIWRANFTETSETTGHTMNSEVGRKKGSIKKNSGTNYCKTNNVHGKTFATNWTCIHVVSYYFIPFWFIFCGWRARICNTLKFIFLNLYHAMTNRNRQEKRARKEEKKRNCESFASSQQIVWMEGKKQLAFCRGHKHIRSAVYQV